MAHDPEPADLVDAEEERVLGARDDTPDGTPDDEAAAFEVDLDPEDQGSADAGAGNPG